MIDYFSTKLFSLLDLNSLVPSIWLYLIIFSLTTWLHWVRFLFPYSFKLFRLQCYSLYLPRGRWQKTLPSTFSRIWLVRPRYHAKYTRMLYPYIPGGFNYSKPYGMHRSYVGITLYASCTEIIIIWICSAHSVLACDSRRGKCGILAERMYKVLRERRQEHLLVGQWMCHWNCLVRSQKKCLLFVRPWGSSQ